MMKNLKIPEIIDFATRRPFPVVSAPPTAVKDQPKKQAIKTMIIKTDGLTRG